MPQPGQPTPDDPRKDEPIKDPPIDPEHDAGEGKKKVLYDEGRAPG
jgi:hypothetical protein